MIDVVMFVCWRSCPERASLALRWEWALWPNARGFPLGDSCWGCNQAGGRLRRLPVLTVWYSGWFRAFFLPGSGWTQASLGGWTSQYSRSCWNKLFLIVELTKSCRALCLTSDSRSQNCSPTTHRLLVHTDSAGPRVSLCWEPSASLLDKWMHEKLLTHLLLPMTSTRAFYPL